MKGFVLAAGFGSRLRPLTDVVPKPLLRVGQTPLIGYALRLLAHHDIREVIVNTHHLDERLREEVGDGSEFEVDIVYSHEPEILGTGGAIKKMQAALDETFVLLNSDVLIGLDLADVIASHHRSGGIATMVLREDADHPASGAIEIDKDDCVRRILGDGDASANLQPMMFTGCHVIEPRFLEYLPPRILRTQSSLSISIAPDAG
ncbi:MAG: nucleotidyltransferase family protein, partial [Myxococcota bacterium]